MPDVANVVGRDGALPKASSSVLERHLEICRFKSVATGKYSTCIGDSLVRLGRTRLMSGRPVSIKTSDARTSFSARLAMKPSWLRRSELLGAGYARAVSQRLSAQDFRQCTAGNAVEIDGAPMACVLRTAPPGTASNTLRRLTAFPKARRFRWIGIR